MVLGSQQISSTITVMWDGKYWMALFERRDNQGYSVAKATISEKEPNEYCVEEFLNRLDRGNLQFTLPGDEPITTKTIIVERKQKFEKTHSVEVKLKNPYRDAKTKLYNQKIENKIARREKDKAIKREQNKQKQDTKLAKKIEKHRGR